MLQFSLRGTQHQVTGKKANSTANIAVLQTFLSKLGNFVLYDIQNETSSGPSYKVVSVQGLLLYHITSLGCFLTFPLITIHILKSRTTQYLEKGLADFGHTLKTCT